LLALRFSVLFADLDAMDADGQSPLQQATQAGHTTVVRLLLEHGAKVVFSSTALKKVPVRFVGHH
jgi:ankyrin repeat protein